MKKTFFENKLVINDNNPEEVEERDSFNIYKIRQKYKENKWKVIIIGIFLILFCLIVILFWKLLSKDETPLEKPPESTPSPEIFIDPYFKKYSEIFPLALIANSEGQIETDNSCLEEIPINKISFQKENSYYFKKVEVEQNSKSSFNSDFSISLDTSFYCDAKFKRKFEELEGKSNKAFLIGAKYNICSLNIKRDNIVLSEPFLNKIKDIADDDISDEEKAKELDKLFKDYGYYIPLKIYIGGYFYREINIQEGNQNLNELLDFNANLKTPYVNVTGNYSSKSENYLKNFFSEQNLVIKGGDIDKDSFDDWKLSINFDNSEIIEFSKIIKTPEIINDALDKDTKKLLKVPLSLIEEKYKKREMYYEHMKESRESKSEGEIQGTDSHRNGICHTDEIIYSIIIDMRDDTTINNYYDDLIVGWKIHSFWTDGTNGKYTITDPVNSRQVKATFKTRFLRELHFSLELFLLKPPE